MHRTCLILLASFSACTSSESAPTQDRSVEGPTPGLAAAPSATLPQIRFARSLGDAEAGSFADSFQLLAQRDIVIKIEVPLGSVSSEVAFLHFQLINPDGVPHLSKWYALSTKEDAPTKVRHPVLGTDLPVQRAEVQGRAASFYGKIPVAGTNFTRYHLTGAFTATLHVGLEAAQPWLSQTFVMEL